MLFPGIQVPVPSTFIMVMFLLQVVHQCWSTWYPYILWVSHLGQSGAKAHAFERQVPCNAAAGLVTCAQKAYP